MPAQPAPAPVQRLPYHAPLGARLCDRCLFPQAMAAADPSADALEPLWPYLRSNPGLLVILTAKASGALTWGLAELIEVELSALSSFQLDGSCAHPSPHPRHLTRSALRCPGLMSAWVWACRGLAVGDARSGVPVHRGGCAARADRGEQLRRRGQRRGGGAIALPDGARLLRRHRRLPAAAARHLPHHQQRLAPRAPPPQPSRESPRSACLW